MFCCVTLCVLFQSLLWQTQWVCPVGWTAGLISHGSVWPAPSPALLTPRTGQSSSTERSSAWHQGSAVILIPLIYSYYNVRILYVLITIGWCCFPSTDKIRVNESVCLAPRCLHWARAAAGADGPSGCSGRVLQIPSEARGRAELRRCLHHGRDRPHVDDHGAVRPLAAGPQPGSTRQSHGSKWVLR